ncbi:MAG: dynamin family protein [Desulfurispora sp.]|uniref:dynamin family protein n=1 Tax=Desulfurispora sp. TaxID=3014275 RepID=UPI00404B89A5
MYSDNLLEQVSALREFWPDLSGPALYLCGPVGSGKSTLGNLLLGEDILPAGFSPRGHGQVICRYGPQFRAVLQKGRREMEISTGTGLTLALRRWFDRQDVLQIWHPAALLQLCHLVEAGSCLPDENSKPVLSAVPSPLVVLVLHARGPDWPEVEQICRWQQAVGPAAPELLVLVNTQAGGDRQSGLAAAREMLGRRPVGRCRMVALDLHDPQEAGELVGYVQGALVKALLLRLEKECLERDRQLARRWHQLSSRAAGVAGWSGWAELWQEARRIREAAALIQHCRRQAGNWQERLLQRCGSDSAARRQYRFWWGEKPGDASNKARPLSLRRPGDPYRVLLLGPFSSGKSSFINALLGKQLLPVEDRSTTLCPVEVRSGSEWQVRLALRQAVSFEIARMGLAGGEIYRPALRALSDLLAEPALEACWGGFALRYGSRVETWPAYRLAALRASLAGLAGAAQRPGRLSVAGVPHEVTLYVRPGAADLLAGGLDPGTGWGRLVSRPLGWLMEKVEIVVPAAWPDNLVLVDTPGLDGPEQVGPGSVTGQLPTWLAAANCCLLFVSARQVLAGRLPSLWRILESRELTGMNCHYVLTFADLLGPRELERAAAHLRYQLPLQRYAAGRPRIFIISTARPQAAAPDGINALRRWLFGRAAGQGGEDVGTGPVD